MSNKMMIGAEVEQLLETGLWTDHAREMQQEVGKALERSGFLVQLEFSTAKLGDTRNGRIDIVASKAGENVAIELDCRSPRSRCLAESAC